MKELFYFLTQFCSGGGGGGTPGAPGVPGGRGGGAAPIAGRGAGTLPYIIGCCHAGTWPWGGAAGGACCHGGNGGGTEPTLGCCCALSVLVPEVGGTEEGAKG